MDNQLMSSSRLNGFMTASKSSIKYDRDDDKYSNDDF